MLTNLEAERLMKKIGVEKYQEKICLIQEYKEKWDLSEVEFQPSLSINNIIFYANSKKYGKVIFKILLNHGFDSEILALKTFQGSNFCSLYDYSLEDRIYIMERVSPADTLMIGTTREERIKTVASIFQTLHKPSISDTIFSNFPTYLEWFYAGKTGVQQRKDCGALLYDLEKAEDILLGLWEKYPRRLLLHGDLHHENILKNKTGGYTVIDPKGVVGDPVFDLSRFILDEFRDDLTAEPAQAIIAFVQALGKEVGIPSDVLLQCLYVETVIWLFREELATGEPLDECESLITNVKTARMFIESL